MRVLTYNANGVTVFVLVGRHTLETFRTLKDQVRGSVDRGGCQLVLDLARASFVDNIGVSDVVRNHLVVDTRPGTFILATPDHLTRFLERTHLDTIRSQRQRVPDAVTQLTGGGVVDV